MGRQARQLGQGTARRQRRNLKRSERVERHFRNGGKVDGPLAARRFWWGQKAGQQTSSPEERQKPSRQMSFSATHTPRFSSDFAGGCALHSLHFGQVRQASAAVPTLGAVELQARKRAANTCRDAELREAKRRRARTAEEKELAETSEELEFLQRGEEKPFGIPEDFDVAHIAAAQAPLLQGSRTRLTGKQSVGQSELAPQRSRAVPQPLLTAEAAGNNLCRIGSPSSAVLFVGATPKEGL